MRGAELGVFHLVARREPEGLSIPANGVAAIRRVRAARQGPEERHSGFLRVRRRGAEKPAVAKRRWLPQAAERPGDLQERAGVGAAVGHRAEVHEATARPNLREKRASYASLSPKMGSSFIRCVPSNRRDISAAEATPGAR